MDKNLIGSSPWKEVQILRKAVTVIRSCGKPDTCLLWQRESAVRSALRTTGAMDSNATALAALTSSARAPNAGFLKP